MLLNIDLNIRNSIVDLTNIEILNAIKETLFKLKLRKKKAIAKVIQKTNIILLKT